MENSFQCSLISPEKLLFSKEVEYIACPMEDGEIGILPNHAPLLGTVGTGLVRITEEGAEIKFAVDKGFIEIRDNNVSILVTRAKTSEDINKSELEKRIQELNQSDLGNPQNKEELEWLKTQSQIAK